MANNNTHLHPHRHATISLHWPNYVKHRIIAPTMSLQLLRLGFYLRNVLTGQGHHGLNFGDGVPLEHKLVGARTTTHEVAAPGARHSLFTAVAAHCRQEAGVLAGVAHALVVVVRELLWDLRRHPALLWQLCNFGDVLHACAVQQFAEVVFVCL